MKVERIAPANQTLVQRALGGHAAIGLLAGALLYIIALSGTLIVIHERWQRWEQPAMPEMTAIAPEAIAAALRAGLAADPGKPKTTHLYVHLPTTDLPRTVVTTDHGGHYVDAAGRIAGREGHAWTEFLVGLHEYLHLPATIGLIAVGALGVMLAALAVTGVVAHPRILRDAFRLRARGDRQLAQADWHNRLGVWALPFTLALALTGAFIGLGSVGVTVLARAYHGGDVMKVYAPVFGAEPKPDPAAAPLPDVAAALRALAAREPGVTPTYVIVHDPGTRGQHVQILADHSRRLIYGESYAFDAAARWHGAAGLSDGALGQQTAASAYKLHFGNFGGLPVMLAYMAFGTALCVVSATGMSLWLEKRRRRGFPTARLEAFWAGVVWGTPLLFVLLLWARAVAGPDAPLAVAFWMALAAGLVAVVSMPRRRWRVILRRVLAGAVGVTGLGHAVVLWPQAVEVLAIDGVLLVLAVVIIVAGGWPRRRAAT